MNLRKSLAAAMFGAFMLLIALPARAGIPVIDAANLANSIQQVVAWSRQAQDMINQLNQLQQQFQQLQAMTNTLNGVRNLGTILNNPLIRDQLPPEMRDATQLLLNPTALATSQANITQLLSAFGIQTGTSGTVGQTAADTLGRMQQILASTQTRSKQISQLASRVDTTTDAKDSLDLINRNVIEAASVNNQMMQTMASIEAARQAAELKRIADEQAYYSRLKSGLAKPLKSYSY